MSNQPDKCRKRIGRQIGHQASNPIRSKQRCGHLPEWNLDDLYSGLDDPAIKRDLDRADAECVAFEDAYKGKLAAMAAARRRRRGARRGGAAL